MQMIYNVDFLIASLAFMLLILYHFMQQQAQYMQDNHSFLWLVFLGISNICTDLLCVVLVSWGGAEMRYFTEFCLTVFFCLQILVPNAMVNHVFSQFPKEVGSSLGKAVFSYIIPGILLTMIVANHWTHLFFVIDETGTYQLAEYAGSVYLYGGIYLLISAMVCIVHRKYLSQFKRYAILEMVLIAGITILFQAIYRSVLLIGFGITMDIAVLFFTLNNPYHYTDSLTSSFDIRYFRERVRNNIEHRKSFHIIVVELSQLKRINHVTGAGVGNDILQLTARMLRETDKHNLVFRVTGKQLVLLTNSLVNYESARTQILEFFNVPMQIGERTITVPVTVCGILNAEELGDSDTLLSYIEYMLSLVTAPHRGTQLIQNSEETLKGYQYNQTIDQYLNTAVREDLFTLNYQPVYSTVQKKFTNMEALSRLSHPTLGPISPEIFIRLAEKNDLIPQIGQMQLRKICSFVKENPIIMEQMDSVKVNLSPVELMRPGHVDLLISTIREAGLPTEFFQFEVTETVATEYSISLERIADKLLDAGIKLCLDDFGSGFANLNAVFRLPFSTIKLDRSLLVDICQNAKAASLYHGLSAAIHSMDASIVAEGVETSQELERVTGCGVDLIQGFYFSRPLPPEDLLALLKKQKETPSEEA